MSDELRQRLTQMACLQEKLELELEGCPKLAAEVTKWLDQGREIQARLLRYLQGIERSLDEWSEVRQAIVDEHDAGADWWKHPNDGEDDPA